ncbi:MAG: alanine/glycine:cation symporter family protein [Bacteroidota bacterium]|nr:alanine/glycine:cation symporter family protein [Bacteroidota bacterium]
MKKITLLFIILSGLSLSAQDFEGTWAFESIRYEVDTIGQDIKPIDSESDLLTINKDGTFDYTLNKIDLNAKGTWQLKSDKMILNYFLPSDTVREYLVIINDAALVLNENGINYSFKKYGLDDKINAWFKPIADTWVSIVLYPINFSDSISIPIVLLLLVFGALFFTIRFSFVNISHFPTAINTVRGKYDELEHGTEKTDMTVDGDIPDTIRDESQDGEVSHFQALATAVSGTVGLGNIAGVALAIALGGPGATFWMIVCGFIGMSTKFVECTLGVKYRDVGEDGTVYGGPMYYLTKGFKENGYGGLGKIFAVLFAVLCVGASFGGGNAAQSNQAALQLASMLGLSGGSSGTIIGIFLAILVGIVIIGGIKRIASVTEKIVPFMAIIYVMACLFIIFSNFSYIDDAFGLIFSNAFSMQAGFGGLVGVMIVGFQRAAFSNEAGAGSASIAHSAVKTKYPASEGVVALLEPFIDTIVICTMTALVIIMYNSTGIFEYGQDVIINGEKVEGAVLTSMAFADAIPWFPVILTIAIILFALSTMISWSYYGLQSWMYLFGKSKLSDLVYKFLFLIFIVIGAAANMDAVWGFSDAMILALIFPNMIGLFFLYPKVKEELIKYVKAIKK